MIDFKEKLLPIFNGNTKNVEAYLDYITSKAVKKVEVYTEQHHILPKGVYLDLYRKFQLNQQPESFQNLTFQSTSSNLTFD